jgi:tellurium resistance protein TerZ
MAIELNKKTGINLKKGSSISLEKNGKRLDTVCIGLNWGMIQSVETTSFLGFFKSETVHQIAVDLDGSASFFDGVGEHLDTVYYRKLVSDDGAVRHSGDDLVGDRAGDDGADNEVLEVRLSALRPEVQTVFLYVNSFRGQDFASIPYATIRLFEGRLSGKTPIVESVIATFNVAAEAKFRGYRSMILGKLVRSADGSWQCVALGEPVEAADIKGTIETIQSRFLG